MNVAANNNSSRTRTGSSYVYVITIEASWACTFFNPFLPEFIIAAEPLNARDKMLAPGRYSKRARNATSSAFFRPNGSSNDFIVYSCVPEEL